MLLWLKRFLPKSLFGRTLLILVSPLVLLQAIAAYVFFETHWDTLARRLSASVAGDVAMVAELSERSFDAAGREAFLDTALRNTGIRFGFVDGAILPNTPDRGDDGSTLAALLIAGLEERVQRPFTIDNGADDRHVLIGVQLAQGVLTATVSRKRLFSTTTYVFLLWMVGSSLILVAIAAAFMRNQVRPIRRLAAAAEAFGKGRDTPGFKIEGATEVRRAALEFLRMRERITRAVTQRTEMLAGVSHDLRTPLTRMKLALAFLPESPETAELQSDIAEMERMVDGYLAFARGEGTEPTVATDLKGLIEDVVTNARRAGADVSLTLATLPSLSIKPMALKRGLDNLIGNAARYGSHIAVAARQDQTAIEITVDDNGPGIPRAQREDVFKPFYRLDKSRNAATGGVGLGLTIARDVVRSHGGEVMLADSPLGGLRATIRLPV
ncbi:MAG: HAMP domain-containing protein [Alphaproteobacteria bacterium]|nr:MAG: HAMP domain-containing protein [Alphaproteobacteria bacterium]